MCPLIKNVMESIDNTTSAADVYYLTGPRSKLIYTTSPATEDDFLLHPAIIYSNREKIGIQMVSPEHASLETFY